MIIPTFISRIIFLFLIFVMINESKDSYWAILSQGITISFCTLTAIFLMQIKYKFEFQKLKFTELKKILLSSSSYLVNSIVNNQGSTFWGFGLSYIGGAPAMALYNLADIIYRGGSVISNIIAQSLRVNFKYQSLYQLRIPVVFFIFLFLSLSILLIIIVEPIISSLFSYQYLSSLNIIKIMILAWMLNATVKLINYPMLGIAHNPNWVNKITLFFLIMNIIGFFVWAIYFKTTITMVIFFCGIIFLQLMILVVILLTSNKL